MYRCLVDRWTNFVDYGRDSRHLEWAKLGTMVVKTSDEDEGVTHVVKTSDEDEGVTRVVKTSDEIEHENDGPVPEDLGLTKYIQDRPMQFTMWIVSEEAKPFQSRFCDIDCIKESVEMAWNPCTSLVAESKGLSC